MNSSLERLSDLSIDMCCQPIEPLLCEGELLVAIPLGDHATDDLGVEIEVVVYQCVVRANSLRQHCQWSKPTVYIARLAS